MKITKKVGYVFTVPEKIYIAGREIDVIIDDVHCMRNGVIGECRINENKIYMSSKGSIYSEDEIAQTFIHECIHVINAILKRGDCDEETYVSPLSELVYQVYKQV